MTNREVVSLTKDEIKQLLEVLDYKIKKNGEIIDNKNHKLICEFTNKPVKIENLAIVPGSLKLINANPLSLSEYFYQYPEALL